MLLAAPQPYEDWRGRPVSVFTLVTGGARATGLVACLLIGSLTEVLRDPGLDAGVRRNVRVVGRRALPGHDDPLRTIPGVPGPELLVVEVLEVLNEGDDVVPPDLS